MSKKITLAVVAAASAATGAGITAFLYSRASSSLPPTVTSKRTSPSLVTSTAPVDPAGLRQYGFPGPISDVLQSLPLWGAYDRRLRNPVWVAEHLTPASLAIRDGDRQNSTFHEDETLPPMFRAKLTDYFRSGYDRGHQVPAADAKWSQEAMDATFALSNMCPQVGDGFNRDYWAHLESFCRSLTHRYPSVRIVTGPLYLPKRDPDGKYRVTYEVIGNPPNVAVPTHFYKVIFAEHGTRPTDRVALAAFVLPNARIPNDHRLADWEVPLEAVERASGLEFASQLDPTRRTRLCQEVKCDLVVRDFKNANRNGSKKGST
ncbi:hypothetical protein V8E54_003606 [Elaphomyces granulatus]